MIELVRNSYDADASLVEISFTDTHLPEKTAVQIADDGHGMDRPTLLGPWLEPATDFKEVGGHGPRGGERSPRGRRRLGAKGVGRFAAQRLGTHLGMQTSDGQGRTLEAEFDWAQLDGSDRYLDQLSIPWREVRSKPRRWHGTALEVTALRERWTPARFDRLRVALSRLLGPRDKGDRFQIKLVIDGRAEAIRPAVETLPPMYSIRGRVKRDGRARIEYQDLLGVRERWDRTVLWPTAGETCGPFRFRISAWDLDRVALAFFLEKSKVKLGPRDFRRTLRDHSGISIYRDGFRILPYGEPDNDWLRLDRRRVNNPTLRLSNNQILGTIQIGAEDNPWLRDQTNREGLVANDAYTHLQHVIVELLAYFETRRFASRRASSIGGGAASQRVVSPLPSSRHEPLLARLDEAGHLDPAELAALRTSLQEQRETSIDSIRRYASLAAAGQLAGAVFTRVLHPLRQVQSELLLAVDEVEAMDIPAETREDVLGALRRSERRLRAVRHILDKLDPLARPRGTRKRARLDIAGCASDVGAMLSTEIAQGQIDYRFVTDSPSHCVGDPTVVEQVMAMLFDNALHWLTHAQPPRQLVMVEHRDGFTLENNGPPIADADRELVFEPHFTRRPDAPGMGLALARDLLVGIGGNLQLLGSPRNMGTAFRVTLPAIGGSGQPGGGLKAARSKA